MTRILHVVRPSVGGAFGHVRVLARETAERGHEVAVCGPAEQADRGLQVPHIDVEMGREIRPDQDLRALAGVASAYRSFRPDVIHAHGSQAGVLARLARAARPRVPLIHTPHQYAFVNYFAGPGRSRAYRVIERMLMPLASRVLCVCEAERRLALGIGAGDRAVVVHNGIVPLRREPLDPSLSEWAGTGPLIAVVAELHERKGLTTMIDAMPSIRDGAPGTKLIVAGEGEERASLERRIALAGLGDAVLLAGQLDGVSGLLGAADVFVNPAWAEAFPYAVLEAMSLGRACVVTDVGGTAEAIVDGEGGTVIAPRDPESLAASVLRLLADKELAARYGEAARQRLLQRFTRTQMIEGTLAVYEELGATSP